jgi:hypothetical protein
MSALRVLVTNWTMAERHGSVLYTRDLALGLKRRGHEPRVYTPADGEVGRELAAAGISVATELDGEPAPDVIHGNSHPDLIAALARFPGVPALHVCHARGLREAEPPFFPRVRRYVAVDENCAEWLLVERGIAPDRLAVVPNAVDLQRFRPRAALPRKPRRALVFSNYASAETGLERILQACRRNGMEAEAAGDASGGSLARPEDVLGRYDVVFAKARCALEAMATGCAVILCDYGKLGPAVTTQNWHELRRWNFGRRVITDDLREESVLGRLAQYDAADAVAVAELTRAQASLDVAVGHLESIYRSIIDEQRAAGPGNTDEEMKALSSYLSRMDCFSELRQHYVWGMELRAENARLKAEVEMNRRSPDVNAVEAPSG